MGRVTVSNQNDNIRYVGTVSICAIEHLRSHESQPAGGVCVSAEILNISDCRRQRPDVGEICEVEVQSCFVTLTQQSRHNTTTHDSHKTSLDVTQSGEMTIHILSTTRLVEREYFAQNDAL